MDKLPVLFQVHTHQADSTLTPGTLSPPLDVAAVRSLMGLTAFWARDRRLEDLAMAIANSDPVVSAVRGEELIAFARATSDGVYRATIWDVVVHPDCQGQGIGRKLVETLLSHPRMCRVERVYLMTTYQQRFYERIGFETNTSTTMVLHNQPLDIPLTAQALECAGL